MELPKNLKGGIKMVKRKAMIRGTKTEFISKEKFIYKILEAAVSKEYSSICTENLIKLALLITNTDFYSQQYGENNKLEFHKFDSITIDSYYLVVADVMKDENTGVARVDSDTLDVLMKVIPGWFESFGVEETKAFLEQLKKNGNDEYEF